MKKAISLMTAALIAGSCLSVTAAAVTESDIKLPFELTAPEHVAISKLTEGDAFNTCSVVYSQNDSMSKFFTKKADPEEYEAVVAELEALGLDDIWVNPQMDWSIDTQDDWHYNKYWDTDGYDEDSKPRLGDWAYIQLSYSSDTAMSDWVFRDMGNIKDEENTTWYGSHNEGADFDGWKDVLKEDQYEVVDVDDEQQAKIDFTQHTIYVRMRWLVTCRTPEEDIKIASDWSEIASVGKDASSSEILDESSFKELAPVIKDLRMTDEEFNGQPVIAFTLEVPDELKKTLTFLTAGGGGITLCTEARIKDKTDWTELQGDWTIKTGELKVTLIHLVQDGEVIDEGTPVELRCCYIGSQGGVDGLLRSDYSEVLTFGTKELDGRRESAVSDETDGTSEAVKPQNKDENKCKVCGICPVQPLGICLFIWIAIILVLVIVIVVVVIVVTKNKKNKDK